MFFKKKRKTILFFPVNGSGLGHLNRCLAYARHMPEDWKRFFFSLSAAIEPIEQMGFEADYFISHFWTANNSTAWNRELAVRLGLMLEYARPDILLFDGTYPYMGLRRALLAYKKPLKLVWSRRGLWKDEKKQDEALDIFDLLIQPGEISGIQEDGDTFRDRIAIIKTPPVTLFDRSELFCREKAREFLNLDMDKKYILFSPGSGNLKNVENISLRIAEDLQMAGYTPVWLLSPIATKAQCLPDYAMTLRKYPMAQYMKAFDGFVSAAGYNSCYESAMAAVPTLFLPNEKLLDNQEKRASFLAMRKLAVICEKEDETGIREACHSFLQLLAKPRQEPLAFQNGAHLACKTLAGMIA